MTLHKTQFWGRWQGNNYLLHLGYFPRLPGKYSQFRGFSFKRIDWHCLQWSLSWLINLGVPTSVSVIKLVPCFEKDLLWQLVQSVLSVYTISRWHLFTPVNDWMKGRPRGGDSSGKWTGCSARNVQELEPRLAVADRQTCKTRRSGNQMGLRAWDLSGEGRCSG